MLFSIKFKNFRVLLTKVAAIAGHGTNASSAVIGYPHIFLFWREQFYELPRVSHSVMQSPFKRVFSKSEQLMAIYLVPIKEMDPFVCNGPRL